MAIGCDSLLDIGCASGDVTIDLVLPILPANFELLIGCDLSNEMIEFARKKYIIPNVYFEQFNLAIDAEKQSLWTHEKFDHITSFYCLMWVHDQKTAVQNFYKLLKARGDLLAVFLTHHPLYDIYKKQAKNQRWFEFMSDVDKVITPYQYSKDAENEFAKLLAESGFAEFKVELREKCFTFTGVEHVKSRLTPCLPS